MLGGLDDEGFLRTSGLYYADGQQNQKARKYEVAHEHSVVLVSFEIGSEKRFLRKNILEAVSFSMTLLQRPEPELYASF